MTRARLDARRHQLKILKLEKRGLKPLATTLLSPHSTATKLAAIGAVSAMLLSLQDAPEAFYRDVAGVGTDHPVTASTVSDACSLCEHLSQLVKDDASAERLYSGVESLFRFVRDSHQAVEAVAKAVGARLIEERPVGGGGKDDPLRWLSQLSIGLRGSSSGL
ncbi:MAG: hypothetical protein ABL957_14495 [Parvularculaceae bacterium]